MSESVTHHLVKHQDIRRFAFDAFKAVDCKDEVAELTAYALWLTTIRGVDSHAIRLLPHYVSAVEGGRLNPQPNITIDNTAPATAILDADHTLGHVACLRGMRHAMQLAETAGVGVVVIKNSSHNGAMATYGIEAANNNMIGLATTNAAPKVRTPNSTSPFFGTNPTCIAAPMLNEEPFCFDATPVPFSANKVKTYAEDGKTLPHLNVAADEQGNPTADPSLAFQMLPIGDYKGFGFLMMADVLSSMLSGMPSGDNVSGMFGVPLSEKRYLAQFCIAIRISAFRDLDEFKQDLQNNADKIRQQPRIDTEIPVMIPGDPEKATTLERTTQGVPVKAFDMEQFNILADRLKIEPLHPKDAR